MKATFTKSEPVYLKESDTKTILDVPKTAYSVGGVVRVDDSNDSLWWTAGKGRNCVSFMCFELKDFLKTIRDNCPNSWPKDDE